MTTSSPCSRPAATRPRARSIGRARSSPSTMSSACSLPPASRPRAILRRRRETTTSWVCSAPTIRRPASSGPKACRRRTTCSVCSRFLPRPYRSARRRLRRRPEGRRPDRPRHPRHVRRPAGEAAKARKRSESMSIDDDDEATRILPSHAPKPGSAAQRTEIAPARTETVPPAGAFDPDGDATVIRPRPPPPPPARRACPPRTAATCCRSASTWASSRSPRCSAKAASASSTSPTTIRCDRRVALKEYMPSSLAARVGGTQVSVKSERHRETFEAGLKSFVNEARLLAQFDHPSLVKVYRFWEANGTAYMVMPFYEGITLQGRSSRRWARRPTRPGCCDAAGAADRGARGDPRRAVLPPRHRARQRDPAEGQPAGRCCSTSAPRAASSAT